MSFRRTLTPVTELNFHKMWCQRDKLFSNKIYNHVFGMLHIQCFVERCTQHHSLGLQKENRQGKKLRAEDGKNY